MFLSTNRGCGIFTVFSRTNFKGVCIGGRACVDDATVKVDERHSPSHCTDVSRKDKTSRSSDYATGRTSFGQQTHNQRTKSKAKGAADRIDSRITGCPAARSEKNDLLTLCVMARGHEIRAWIEIDDRGVTSPLVSHSLSQFFFSFFISKSTGAEKRFRLWTVWVNSLLIIVDPSKFTLAIYNDTKIRWSISLSSLIKNSI